MGDRVIIEGANGSGKTCLARFIADPTEQRSLVEGKVEKVNYKSFLVDQQYLDMRLAGSIWEFISLHSRLLESEARSILSSFGISLDDLKIAISSLSGGQVGRVLLAAAFCALPEVLILDEPTNNLDIFTKQLLAHALMNYPATFVLISHDKWFNDQLGEGLVHIEML